MTHTAKLPSHKHPLVLREVLRSLNDTAGTPTANHVYAELERGLENWGWNKCAGELQQNGKRMRCEAGQVRKGKFLYVCGQCHGKGGWHGDPYDQQQQTIRNGHQKPSTFTVTDFAILVLDMNTTNEGGKAIDRATWLLEQRLTIDTTTTTTTNRGEHPNVTEVRIALHHLHRLVPHHHGLIIRVHVDQWTPEPDLQFAERRDLHDGLIHLGRLLPVRWCAPRQARERAAEWMAA